MKRVIVLVVLLFVVVNLKHTARPPSASATITQTTRVAESPLKQYDAAEQYNVWKMNGGIGF